MKNSIDVLTSIRQQVFAQDGADECIVFLSPEELDAFCKLTIEEIKSIPMYGHKNFILAPLDGAFHQSRKED